MVTLGHKTADEDSERLTLEILKCLGDDEIEHAAGFDYHYATNKSSHDRFYHAKKTISRYVESARRDKGKALTKLKDTIRFRRERDLNALRTALDNSSNDYHKEVKAALSSRQLYVQGYDRDGRSTFVFLPRREKHRDAQTIMTSHLWTIEKAIACSKAKDKTINAVVDFNHVTRKNLPPLSVGKEVMTTLRNHYVGHVNMIFLLNVPTAFRWMWGILKPFAGRSTRNKVRFVSSPKDQEKQIGPLYDQNEATPWMLPGGMKLRDIDINEYTDKLPFDQAFDE